MQMLEPDFWKCRGRYSRQACRKSDTDTSPISVEDVKSAGSELSKDS
jgi:hypothetical protein